jgi:ketosteroid isomerase-like protein
VQSINTILDDLYDAWRHQDLTWLASYLPADFSHVILIPEDIHPLGGVRQGKREALDRLARIVADYEFEQFDTSGLLAAKTRAAVEIPLRYRHRQSGARLETSLVDIWTFEAGWPVQLIEYHDVARIRSFMASLPESE